MAVAMAAALAGLGGCSVAPTLPYPKFSSVKRITKKLLTNEEKDAAIQDLTLEQKQHREQAERELEKR